MAAIRCAWVSGIWHHLARMDEAFATISKFPTLKELPIVIGEFDPEGAAAAQGPELHYRN